MPKYLVPHHELGETPHHYRPLDAETNAALMAHWSDSGSANQIQLLFSCLEKARESKEWIACDCLDSSAQTAVPPILMIGQKGSGTLYLIRKSGRPEHAETCPFRLTQEEARARLLKTQQLAPVIKPDDRPNVLGEMHTDSLVSTPERRTNQTSTKYPLLREEALFHILAWIIEGSGINRCGFAPTPLHSQWHAINEFARSQSIGDDLTLADVLIREERWLKNGEYQRPFYAIAKKTNPSRRSVAYLLFVANALHRVSSGQTQIDFTLWEEVEAGQGRKPVPHAITVPCEVHIPVCLSDTATAPYLVLIKLAANSKGKGIPLKGVAQPIERRTNLFPVASGSERKTLRKLLSIGEVRQRHDGYFLIEKPVQGRKTPDGTLCRPDFMIYRDEDHSQPNTLIVETIEKTQPIELSLKRITLSLMEQIAGEVIEDDRSTDMPEHEANDILYRKVTAWLIHGSRM